MGDIFSFFAGSPVGVQSGDGAPKQRRRRRRKNQQRRNGTTTDETNDANMLMHDIAYVPSKKERFYQQLNLIPPVHRVIYAVFVKNVGYGIGYVSPSGEVKEGTTEQLCYLRIDLPLKPSVDNVPEFMCCGRKDVTMRSQHHVVGLVEAADGSHLTVAYFEGAQLHPHTQGELLKFGALHSFTEHHIRIGLVHTWLVFARNGERIGSLGCYKDLISKCLSRKVGLERVLSDNEVSIKKKKGLPSNKQKRLKKRQKKKKKTVTAKISKNVSSTVTDEISQLSIPLAIGHSLPIVSPAVLRCSGGDDDDDDDADVSSVPLPLPLPPPLPPPPPKTGSQFKLMPPMYSAQSRPEVYDNNAATIETYSSQKTTREEAEEAEEKERSRRDTSAVLMHCEYSCYSGYAGYDNDTDRHSFTQSAISSSTSSHSHSPSPSPSSPSSSYLRGG